MKNSISANEICGRQTLEIYISQWTKCGTCPTWLCELITMKCKEFNIAELSYDPWTQQALALQLQDAGIHMIATKSDKNFQADGAIFSKFLDSESNRQNRMRRAKIIFGVCLAVAAVLLVLALSGCSAKHTDQPTAKKPVEHKCVNGLCK